MAKTKKKSWKSAIKKLTIALTLTITGWATFDLIRTLLGENLTQAGLADPVTQNIAIILGGLTLIMLIGGKSLLGALTELFD